MKKLIIALFTVSILGGCTEDFLQVTPQQNVDYLDAIKDLPTLKAAVTGVYSVYQDNDVYGRTLLLVPDLLADNVFISRRNANRYLPQNENRVLATDGFSTNTWRDLYRIVVNSNNIIQLTPTITFATSEQPDANQLLGEAYFLRALAYFNLVRYFAQPYNATADASHPGVALVLDGPRSIISPSRSSVKAIYEQIVKDLETAQPLMTKFTKGRASSFAAQALLAKVSLYMGDWAKAESLATAVIDGKKYKLYDATNFVASWSVQGATETIFEVANTAVDNAGFDNIGYFYGQAGYGDGLASKNIFDAYSATDVRQQLIINGKRTSGESPAYIVNKYPKGATTRDDSYKVLRLAEVHLIRAEARAQQNKTALALEDLNLIGKRVDPSYVAVTATGEALIDAILTERRKELAFEGDRIYDLTRYKKTFNKYLTDKVEVKKFDNPQLVAPIPQTEIDANKNMVQNTGY